MNIFEGKDIRISDRGKNSNFIESVGNLSVIGVSNFDFFHRIDAPILFSLNFVDTSEGSLANFSNDLEVLHFVN